MHIFAHLNQTHHSLLPLRPIHYILVKNSLYALSSSLNTSHLPISLPTIDSLPSLLNCSQNSIIIEIRSGRNIRRLWLEIHIEGFHTCFLLAGAERSGAGRRGGSKEREGERDTVEFFEDTLYGAGASAATHADVEFIGVVWHFELIVWGLWFWWGEGWWEIGGSGGERKRWNGRWRCKGGVEGRSKDDEGLWWICNMCSFYYIGVVLNYLISFLICILDSFYWHKLWI